MSVSGSHGPRLIVINGQNTSSNEVAKGSEVANNVSQSAGSANNANATSFAANIERARLTVFKNSGLAAVSNLYRLSKEEQIEKLQARIARHIAYAAEATGIGMEELGSCVSDVLCDPNAPWFS